MGIKREAGNGFNMFFMRIPCRVGREGGREQSQRANESEGRDSDLSCTVNQRSRICPFFFLDGGSGEERGENGSNGTKRPVEESVSSSLFKLRG